MKLGILQCDDVRASLHADFGHYAAMFEALFQQVDSALELHFYRVIDGQFPQHVDECDAYICSGSKWGVNDDDLWIRQLEDFTRELYDAQKGLIGICFGHQMIAKALGGKVEKSLRGWGVGIAHADVLVEQAWMQPQQASIALVVCHQDQVCQLPDNARVLMSNTFCPYSMFQVGECFLGLQGHPEFTTQYSAALMAQRRDIIPTETFNIAMDSLGLSRHYQADYKLITKWMLAFLRQTLVTSQRPH
ncbi:GMP synthase [Moritella sp. F3]|uniref:glutamine amidotransferase-related protein n=1 Tax=Moritella sp. F3 TaxID=2718882 RepID=UPI0018E1C785|nr:GMP synthase [Moritella sp. F3]GIC76908.1 GMP synthase [Moritella sp. F1]GIC80091.1 GMP synthase [Moritella sp. F3]